MRIAIPSSKLTSPQDQERVVRREMLRQLGRRQFMSACTSWMGYGLQAFVLRATVPLNLLLTWAGLLVLIEVINGFHGRMLQQRLDNPPALRRTLIAYVITQFFTGLVWGAVLLLPGVAQSPAMLLFNLIVMVAVAIMTVHNLCFHPGPHWANGIGMVLAPLYGAFTGVLPGELGAATLAMFAITRIYSRTTRRLSEEVITVNVANVAMSDQLREANEQLTRALAKITEMTSRDPLTGCLNRSAFMELAQREHARVQRGQTSFGLILLDLDHFGRVNDSFGHGVGDGVIVATADLLLSQLRSADALARWGGEEFLCLIADVGQEALRAKAEALRGSLALKPVEVSGVALLVTASFGIGLADAGESLGQTLERVARAQQEAKLGGRNRVCG